MRIILKNEVEHLGTFGDIVKVAPGYARNYLIPKGLAAEATPGNLRQFEAEKGAFLKKMQVKIESAEALKAKLDAVKLSFTRKTSEEGKLFGSVTQHDIEEGLRAQGFEIERKNIVLADQIKALGTYTVSVKLLFQVVANVTVDVTKEE
jgi:large subunit ribosomal protein L9